jgi:hypothetical protein
MARLPYSTLAQLGELVRQTGLPENTAPTSAFRMLAHAPVVGALVRRLVLALLTETDLDPKLRELVILRVAERSKGPYAWVQHVAIAEGIGVSASQIAALERAFTDCCSPPACSPLFQGLLTLRLARSDLSSRLESATGRFGAYPDRTCTC